MTRERATAHAAESSAPTSSGQPVQPDHVGDDDRVLVPEIHDGRSRARRLVAPVATLVGTAAAVGYLAAVDPNTPGHYPVCPLKLLTGVDCPGCGMLRATHDLAHGDIAGALDHNVLMVVLVPLAAVLWFRWVRRAWSGVTPAVTKAQFRRRNAILLTILVLVLAFGVVRNFVPYLGSGIG